jgi:transcriptional antiterminator RfaH
VSFTLEGRQTSARHAAGRLIELKGGSCRKAQAAAASGDTEQRLQERAHCLSMERGWAVVNTKPHREHIALDNLMRQEFTAYCPVIRKGVSHARRMQDVLRPLFQSYLFVRLDPKEQRWRPILSTVGVRTLVHFGERPSMVANEFIDSLKAREIDGTIVRPPVPYAVGQQVRLAGGCFDGLVAVIIEMDERDRVTVLMDLLNQKAKAKLSGAQIAPI